MTNEEDQQRNLAQLGIEAEAFLNSRLGTHFLKRVDRMIDDNTTLLIDCEPSDIEGNTKYRNQIQVAGLFKIFLAEVIDDGRNAHQQMYDDEALS